MLHVCNIQLIPCLVKYRYVTKVLFRISSNLLHVETVTPSPVASGGGCAAG